MLDMSRFEKENLKDNFFQLMMDYPYLKEADEKKSLLQRAMKFSERVPEFKGWPQNDVAFWNAESFMWRTKIDKGIREIIKHELVFRVGDKNLDLGAGNIVYTPGTAALDFSPEMLQLSDAKEKIIHNLEEPLPFDDGIFDSVSAVFVLNYIENLVGLIKEAHRVLKVGGRFTAVQPAEVNDLYYLHVKNDYSESGLRILLKKMGFTTDSFTKEAGGKKITFFFCEKKIS